jgi:autotransporter-associated beta strand protein
LKSILPSLATLAVLAARLACGQDLLVDFNSTNQDNGPNQQAGYQPYNAAHETSSNFVAARSYSAFNTTVSLQVTWPDTTNNNVQQMIDRGPTHDANWQGQKLNLLTDWIGTDTRTASGGRGAYDGTTGLPTRIVFRLANLPPGAYSYRSYHHDTEFMHAQFHVEISTNNGSSWNLLPTTYRITNSTNGGTPTSPILYPGSGNQDPATLPSTVNFDFTATGQNILIRYTPLSQATGIHQTFMVINGLEVRPASNPTDITLSQNTVSRTAVEGSIVATLSTSDPTPGDSFTYTLVGGTGSNDNGDFSIANNQLVIERQLDESETGNSLSIRIRTTDAAGNFFEKPLTLTVVNDSDNDGLDDTWELTYFQNLSATASENPDTDGLTNLQELTAGTHPLIADTDTDGLSDGDEILTHFTNPLIADSDGDGLSDGDEILIHLTNPLLEDSDGDAYNDAIEISENTDPNDNASFPAFALPLRITEFSTSNTTGIRDGNGQRTDWIEIRNPNPTSIDLAGYRLTDSAANLAKWTFPSLLLPPGGTLVVFASGNNTPDLLGNLHTNFSLSTSGEYLAIVRPNGTIDDHFSPTYPPQFEDVSYGRHPTNNSLRFFSPPTPGTSNGSGYDGVVDPPSFSVTRGFHDSPFDVSLTTPTPLAEITYTLDGSPPTPSSTAYTGTPISISTTSKLRALAHRPGWLSRPVQTHSYIFVDHVAQQPTNPPGWPANWGFDPEANSIVPSDYEMDPRVVNSTLPGYGIRDALLDIPSVSINLPIADFITPPAGIYASPLARVEKQCSVEFLPVDGTTGFQADCKVEIHGNSSRRPFRMQKHSLRLSFSSSVGPAKLDYPLFPDTTVDSFNKLVLRACFTDSWALASWDPARYRPNDSQYLRDVWMKKSIRDMGHPGSHGRFVHLYVNGLYFGLHDLTERLEDDFYAEHLGGEPEHWQVNADFSTSTPLWSSMMAVANASNISTPAGYATIQPYLDLENFADYMLLHFFADSEDWPHHNGYAAANPVSGDGKFRFFVWDQEIALDKFTWNRYASNSGANSPGPLFQRLRLNPEFRLLFADRVKKHLFDHGALSLPQASSRYLDLAGKIDKAIVAESARWGDVQAKTPYGSTVQQPNPLTNRDHDAYPPAPNTTAPGGIYFTREDSWLVERDNIVTHHLPIILSPTDPRGLIQELRAVNLYPTIDAPTFSKHGGILTPSETLTITSPIGTIHFTTDGTDPRDPATGNPATTSSVYQSPITIAAPTTIKSRALHTDGTWSALLEADFNTEVPIAEFLPGTSEPWHLDSNWNTNATPNATSARALIQAPASTDRNIDLTAPLTIGEIRFNQLATPFRNRIRALSLANPLQFSNENGGALLTVEGDGTGWVEFELASEIQLTSPLTLAVHHTLGHPEFGALRLRGRWTGTGGITKTGTGIATFTGDQKLYTGPTLIQQGVLQITQPSTPTASTSLTVQPGGQLRLTSAGPLNDPRIHNFGGPITLHGTGRNLDPGSGLGVLGALRYQPATSPSRATLTNPITLAGPTHIHVDGSTNQLDLTQPITASPTSILTKSGGGTLLLSTDSPDLASNILLENGTLHLAAHITASIEATPTATLTGHGKTGPLTGSGTLLLDNALLQSTSFGGLHTRIHFTQSGDPNLTTPFATANALLATNLITSPPASLHLYLDTPLLPTHRFRGGFLLPAGSDWSPLLIQPSPLVYQPDPLGTHLHANRTWSLVPTPRLTRTPITADLGQGPYPAEILEIRLDGPPTHFASWQAENFSPTDLADPNISGPHADPTRQGIPNLLRHALGLTAQQNPSTHLPQLHPTPTGITFRFPYDPAKIDLIYQVQATSDLSNWTNPQILFDSTTTPNLPTEGWLEITDPTPLIKRFYRLHTTLR